MNVEEIVRWAAAVTALACGSTSATGTGGPSSGPGVGGSGGATTSSGTDTGSSGSSGPGGAGGTAGVGGSGLDFDGGYASDSAAADAKPDGSVTGADQDLVRYVNPFIGTGPANSWLDFTMANGDVFPGAGYPLGMLALSPDTSSKLPGGYDYRDTKIMGFSLTHFSGRGINCYQDVPFIPWVGAIGRSPGTNAADYASNFSHANESASAGYYKVHLDGTNVDVELTTLARAGIERFTFPRGSQAKIIINAGGAINGTPIRCTSLRDSTCRSRHSAPGMLRR